MSVLKYKDPTTGAWIPAPAVKVITEYVGGSAVGVPTDIIAEADRVASSITSKMASNSLNFIVMADMHEMGDSDHTNATIIERYRRANLNAGQGAKLIAEKINPDFFANLGDLAWGSSNTTLHDWAQSVVKARGYTACLEANTEAFFTPGNHDVDYASGYHDENLVAGMIGTYRYVDLTAKKVRVICLNTADTTDGTDSTERVSGEQLQWFAESLDLSSKSDAAEWSIVALSHHPLDWGVVNPLANCLAAYLNGTAYFTTHDGMTVSKDFTGKNMATFIANFHGHTHCFKTANISGTEALRVAIPNACYGRNNEYGTIGNTEFGETTTYNKNDNGTGKNTAFCVVSVDLDRKIIYADCFGAGYDRVISYGGEDIVIYSVTNNLTNATNSNGTATIAEGSSYCATITANSGYELDAITVTMGGVDVTATAVNGNNINITNVTGDIVIMATAIETDDFEYGEFTNLVDSAQEMNSTALYNGTGYKDNCRLSSSSPFESTGNAGFVTTGYIPYTMVKDKLPGTIYIKGANWNEVSNCRLYFFTVAKSTICGPQIQGGKTDNGQLAKSYTLKQLDTDYFSLTPVDAGRGKWAAQNIAASVTDMGFFRISLAGSGANLIITVDEPIHKES